MYTDYTCYGAETGTTPFFSLKEQQVAIPKTMQAVILTGEGGLEKLEVRDDIPVPIPQAGQVLIRVGASSVNNVDINARTGFYANFTAGDLFEPHQKSAGNRFPRIQGIDVCGLIVDASEDALRRRIGERVLVEPSLREPVGWKPHLAWWVGSDCDGGFAEYVVVPAVHALKIESAMSDSELASFPCAYSTAEHMLSRAKLRAGERILITGASGGVGSAAVQLARKRRADVVAVTSRSKAQSVLGLGATMIVDRDLDIVGQLGAESVDVVLDLVAGDQLSQLLTVLRRGGRCAVAGAIDDPIARIDVRNIYLKDVTVFGSTIPEKHVLPDLIRYIEDGELQPHVAASFPLSRIAEAQRVFMAKEFIGKITLLPDALYSDKVLSKAQKSGRNLKQIRIQRTFFDENGFPTKKLADF